MNDNPIFDELVDDLEDHWRFNARYDTCSWCNGHGLRVGYQNDVQDCWRCGGGGQELARDDHGRFTNLWDTEAYRAKREFLVWLRILDLREDVISRMEKASTMHVKSPIIHWSPVYTSSYSSPTWTDVSNYFTNLEFKW